MDWQRHVTVLVLTAALTACSPPAEVPPPKPDPAAIDTSLVWSDFNVEDREDVGDPWNERKPGMGAMYLVVRLTVINDGATRMPVAEMPSVRLLDPNGRAIYPDPDATTVFRSEVHSGVERSREGDLNPGVSARQGFVYEVAREAIVRPGWKLQIGEDPGLDLSVTPKSPEP